MRITLTLLGLLLSSIIFSQAPLFNWEANSTSLADAGARHLVTDGNNNIYTCGIRSRKITQSFYKSFTSLAKFDPNGNLLWEAFDSTGTRDTRIMTMILGDDDNIYMTGWVTDADKERDICLYKYDLNGNSIWKKFYDGAGDSTDYATDLIFQDNSIYIVGASMNNQFASEGLIQKYDLNGNIVWSIIDDFGNATHDDYLQAITYDGTNLVVVGAANRLPNYSSNIGALILAKYGPSGTNIWTQSYYYGNGAFYLNMGGDVATDQQGDIYVTLYDSPDDFAKYNAQGIKQWGINATPTIFSTPASYRTVQIDEMDNIYVSGSAGIGGGIDGLPAFLLTHVDKSGSIIFNVWGTVGGSIEDFDFKSPNEIIALGTLDSTDHPQIINFDSLGNIAWRISYQNNVPQANCNSIAIDSSGNIIIAGFDVDSITYRSNSYQVVKYGNGSLTFLGDLENNIGATVDVFPNPTNNSISIIRENETVQQLQITTLDGKILRSFNPKNALQLDLSDLPPSLYIVKVFWKDGTTIHKIIKQ